MSKERIAKTFDKEPWQKARELYGSLARNVKYLLSGDSQRELNIEGFHCYGENLPQRIIYTFDDKKVYLSVGKNHYSGSFGNYEDLFEMDEESNEKLKKIYRIKSSFIEELTTSNGDYPHISYTWEGGHHNRGKLSELALLFQNGSVLYTLWDNGKSIKNDYSKIENNDSRIIRTLPEVLTPDRTSILGNIIPYKIDFDRKGYEILETMKLEKLIECLENACEQQISIVA